MAAHSQHRGPLCMCLLQGSQSDVCTVIVSTATQLLPGDLACLVCQKILFPLSRALGHLGSAVRKGMKCLVVRLSPAGHLSGHESAESSSAPASSGLCLLQGQCTPPVLSRAEIHMVVSETRFLL